MYVIGPNLSNHFCIVPHLVSARLRSREHGLATRVMTLVKSTLFVDPLETELKREGTFMVKLSVPWIPSSTSSWVIKFLRTQTFLFTVQQQLLFSRALHFLTVCRSIVPPTLRTGVSRWMTREGFTNRLFRNLSDCSQRRWWWHGRIDRVQTLQTVVEDEEEGGPY